MEMRLQKCAVQKCASEGCIQPKGGGKIVGPERVKTWPYLTLSSPARLVQGDLA